MSILEHLQEKVKFNPLGLQVKDFQSFTEEKIIESKNLFNFLSLRLQEFT